MDARDVGEKCGGNSRAWTWQDQGRRKCHLKNRGGGVDREEAEYQGTKDMGKQSIN